METLINGQLHQRIGCAIYTRKSTEEGLEQEYNTLDAQRDACESYIQSQVSRGWEILSAQYDDGGFTGANTERPAFNRLVEDIKAGLIHTVVVYKVDRLSRSLGDFATIMKLFETYGVSFVSVTQYFDTSSSLGRMTLNILITFAQFEREMITERIRDKISRSRKKGKFMGGQPVLGYDVINQKLVINDAEKYQVEKIFNFYLNNRSVPGIVDTLNAWGWTTKHWQTKAGVEKGGKVYTRQLVYMLLKNPLYMGKVRHHDSLYDGEHQPIITEKQFEKVQTRLKENRRTAENSPQKRMESLLRGVLFCTACGSRMIKTHTTRRARKYAYYTCLNIHKNGRKACRNKSVPAVKLDEFVIQHMRAITTNPKFLAAFMKKFTSQKQTDLREIEQELTVLQATLASWEIKPDGDSKSGFESMSDSSKSQGEKARERIHYLKQKRLILSNDDLNAGDITVILNQFFPVWDTLTLNEQNNIMDRLFEQILWDGRGEKLDFHYSPVGITLLHNQPMTAYDTIRNS